MLVAFVWNEAPTGYTTWTMPLLADKPVEVTVVDTILDEHRPHHA